MNQTVITGIVRHVLTALGGGLVANGTVTDSDMQLAVGAIITVVGVAWSAFKNRKKHVNG